MGAGGKVTLSPALYTIIGRGGGGWGYRPDINTKYDVPHGARYHGVVVHEVSLVVGYGVHARHL